MEAVAPRPDAARLGGRRVEEHGAKRRDCDRKSIYQAIAIENVTIDRKTASDKNQNKNIPPKSAPVAGDILRDADT